MKKAAFVLLTMTLPLMAGARLNICMPDVCASYFVGADTLYWKSCDLPFRYGEAEAPAGITPHTKFQDLAPDYSWGVRVYGGITDKNSCNSLNLSWTYFRSTDSETVTPEPGFTLIQDGYGLGLSSPVSSLSARERIRYNKVSLNIGRRFCSSKCSYLYVYVGGRWVDINKAFSSRGVTVAASDILTIDIRSKFCGGGIEAGLRAYSDLGCGFGVSAELGSAAVVGGRHLTYNGFFSSNDFDNFFFSKTQCIIAAEIRVGVNYTYECGCWRLTGELGYENHHYFNALYWQQPESFRANTLLSDFGVGGVYFSLALGF